MGTNYLEDEVVQHCARCDQRVVVNYNNLCPVCEEVIAVGEGGL